MSTVASDLEEASQVEPPSRTSGGGGSGSGCDAAAAAATATTKPASGSAATATAAAATAQPRTERSTLVPRTTLRSRGTDGTARSSGGERPPFSVALGRPEVRFRVIPERRAATRAARVERQRAQEARLRRYYADIGETVTQAVAASSLLAGGPPAQQRQQQQQQQQPRRATAAAAPEAGAARRQRRRVGRTGLVGPDGAYDLEAVEAAHPHMAVRRRASTGCNAVPHDPSGWHTVARPAPLSPSALENVAYNARKTGMVVSQPPLPSSPPSSASPSPSPPPPPLSQPLLATASGALAAGETGSRISAWRDECVKKSAAAGGGATAPGVAEFPPRVEGSEAAQDASGSLNVASFAVLCEDAAEPAAAAAAAAAEPGRGAVEVHTSVLRLLSAGVPPGMPEEQWAGAVERVHCALSEHRSMLQRHNAAAAAARLAETADRAVPAGDACDASLRRATAPAALDDEALRLVTPCAALREHLEWTQEDGGRLSVSLPPQHHYAKASHYHRSLLRGYVDDKVVDAKLRRLGADGSDDGSDDPFCVVQPPPSPPPPPAQLLGGGGGGGHLTTGANLAGRRRTSVMHKLRATVDGTLSQGGGVGGGARGRMRRSGGGDGGGEAAGAPAAHPPLPLPLRSSSISSTGSQGSQGGAAMMGFLQTQQADRRERQRADQQALIDETLQAARRSLDSPRRRQRRTRRRIAGCGDSGDDNVEDEDEAGCAAEGVPVRVHRRLRKPPPLRAADSVLEAVAQAAFGSALRAARPVRLTEAAGEMVNGLEYLREEDEEAADEAALLPTVAAAAYPAYEADLRELRTTNGRMPYPSDEDDGGAPPPAGPVTPAARLRDAMLLPTLGGSSSGGGGGGGSGEAERRAGAAKPRLGRAAPPPGALPARRSLSLVVSAVGGGEEDAPSRPHTSEAALRHYLGVGCSGGGGGQRRRRQLRKHAPQACERPSTQGAAGRQKVRETLEVQNDALQVVRTMKWKAMNRSRRQEQECA